MRARAKCILLAWVIWDKVQETLKKQGNKSAPSSKVRHGGVCGRACVSCVFTCACEHVCTCVFIEKI